MIEALTTPVQTDADSGRRLCVLYVCYLTLADPLSQTQVVAYLAGLATAGHDVHLLTFEPNLSRMRRRHWRTLMAERGIRWHGLRYHKRPSLLATVYDTICGAAAIALWSRTLALDAVHARSQMPAAMALIARRLSRRPPALVFDIRGLMVEEYEEAGRWQPGSIPSRLTSAVQRAAIRAADQIVILTRRGRAKLFSRDDWDRVHVIPTCADLDLISAGQDQRDRVRRRLGLSEARVMVYVGKFPSWSMYTEMAAFFAAARRTITNLHFLILTQADGTEMRSELERHNVSASSYTVTSAPADEMGDYLAASDFAIMFIRAAPSTVCQSPTKLGEFLGAGLPVLYTPGVGDVDELVSDQTGVCVAQHSTTTYEAAAADIIDLLEDPTTAARCRSIAETRLSLDRVGVPGYLEVYDAVARVHQVAVGVAPRSGG